MQNYSRFQKGSGVYVCGLCGKKTRATGRKDNELVELCKKCYEQMQKENAEADARNGGAL